jgi:hypothetical protein
MTKIKFALPALILAAGFVVGSTSTYAKPADASKTKQKCAYCHVDAMKKDKAKDLTDAGKYYKEHNSSLEGYKAK